MVKTYSLPEADTGLRKNVLLYIYMVLLSVLVLFKDLHMADNTSMILIITVSFILFLVFAHKTHFFSIFFFVLPLTSGLPQNYIFGLFIVMCLFKCFGDIKISRSVILAILVVIYELMHFWIEPFSIVEYMRFAVYYSLFILFAFRVAPVQQHHLLLMSKCLVLGFLVAMTSVFLQLSQLHGVSDVLSANIRLGTHQIDIERYITSHGPNGIALYSISSIALIIAFPLYRTKLVRYMFIFVFMFFGLLTLSRNFVFSSAFMLALIMIFNRRSKSLFPLMSIFALFVFIERYFHIGILLNLWERFHGVDDISAGRISILNEYFQVFISTPKRVFFGVGIQDYTTKYDIGISIHNSFFEPFIIWGMIGASLFYVSIINAIIRAKPKYSGSIQWLPFAVFLFSTQFIRLVTTPISLITFALIILVLGYRLSSNNV